MRGMTLALFVLMVAVPDAFAAVDTEIMNGLLKLHKSLALLIGIPLFAFGLLRAFTAHGNGEDDGMRGARQAIISGVGALASPKIAVWVVSLFGFSVR